MPSAYETLVARLRRVHDLGEAASLLQWDQETYMPPGGTEPRASALGTLAALSHEHFTHPDIGRLLAEAEAIETDEKHRALLREVRFQHDRATEIPVDLVEGLSRATTRALPQWVEARKASDFGKFRPILEEILELRRKQATSIDPDAPPYEVLFQDYEPWVSLRETRKNLAALRDGLRPILERAAKRARKEPRPFTGTFPRAGQEALSRRILERLGYDFQHGRLDVSAHPFSTGNSYDARITTRYDEKDPLSALLSTIHEFGHALYTQGLPKDDFGTILGDARDLVVHESQSRLWENHIGRSEAFWTDTLPLWREAFPGHLERVPAEDLWRASNRVEPSLIRVEADELTYHMHIALRFEVEEAIVSGKSSVSEVPGMWNERMQRYLGIEVPDDAHGCLQDVHWSHGAFGYFPTYSLGSMLSAQLFEAFERDHGAAAPLVAAGNYAPLRAWLVDKVHRHGKRYVTGELIEKATGKPLSPDAFLRYANEKYARVWD